MSMFVQGSTGEWAGFQPEGRLPGAIVKAWDGLIYVGGPDFRIRFMNHRFIDTLGRDATGESCYHALHGRDEPCPWCPREVFAGKSVSGFFQKPVDGRWYHVLNFPIPLADGSFAKVAFIRESSEPESGVRDLPVFRNIVDHLSDVIFFHAQEDGSILYVNDLACSSLGYSREALLEMQPPDYSDVPSSPRAWREMVACIEKEGVAVFEAKYRHQDGTFIEVEVKATQVQAGLDRFIVTVARDITERKLAEARLVEERNKVEAIMAATGDGITVQDLDFRIIYQNEVLIRRRGRHLGEPCYRIYANRDRICDDCQAQKSIADGRVHRRPFTTTTPEGDPLHLEITAYPLRDAADKVVACVEVVRDVTERRRLEKSREEAFSAVSHEMRTPLTAVLGFAQFLQENPTSPEQQREYLGRIEKEGQRLKRLIDNLLGLQRLRAGFGLVNPAPVLLYPLLHEVTEHFRTLFVPQRIEIDCTPDVPAVLGETVRLQEAVTHLLDNAVKYSPTGGMIVLGVKADDDRALLWVRDEGPGIPADQQEKIFERFYRLEESRWPPGTGLGLALVREIALAHGGRVWVDSVPRQGSTFYLSLPFAPG
jgi:PAS domain S-box-containing protein